MGQRHLLIALLLALGCNAQAAEPGWETSDRIRAIVSDFARQQAGPQAKIDVGALDDRLRLPACNTPPQAFSPAGSTARGALSVGVRCDGPTAWSLYVPVRIGENRNIVVINRSINRGEIITDKDVALQERDITSLPYGYLANASDVVGKTIKRPLTAGSVVTPDALELQRIVKRGQSVTLISRIGSAEIRAQGKALSDGGQGDRVKVENASSRRVIEGVVRSADTVEVSL